MKHFNREDLAQLILGAFALAVPISFSEEAWRLGESLPTTNLLLLVVLTLAFLSFFAYESIFRGNIRHRKRLFVFRVAVAYCLTCLVVAFVLTAINKFPLLSDPLIAFRRMLVIAMPAAMGAIIVDSLDKE